MILKSFRYFFSLLLIFLFLPKTNSEESIDIWKNKKTEQNSVLKNPSKENKINAEIKSAEKIVPDKDIKIEGEFFLRQ